MLSVNKAFQITTLLILESASLINAFRIFDVNGVETILALENENVSMLCKTGMSMAYCGFIHPSGKRYSFSGNSLINGHCAVKIKATKNDTGYWKCHIGKASHTGIELSKDIELRVVDKLAAIEPSVKATHRNGVTLTCVTTKEKLPLKYCRFEPPNGDPFSIDSAITATEPLLNRYYYPQNKSLDRGDCAVTIHQAKYSDAGVWTCGAGFDDGQEHTDQIRLDVEGLYTMSTGSTTGIISGVFVIIAFLAVLAVIVWKKRRLMGATVQREPQPIEIEELQQRPRTPSPSRSLSSVSHMVRVVPSIVVQSPSEPRSSP